MIRTTRYGLALRTLASLPMWWMLPVLVAAVLLMLWIYWRQTAGVARLHRHLLLGLRLATVAVVAFLLFRPRLEITRVTDWGGRFVLLVDNSGSLGIADSFVEPGALRGYARRVGGIEDGQPHYRAILEVDALAALVHELGRRQAGDFAASNRYWRFLESRRPAVAQLVEALAAQVEADEREWVEEILAIHGETVADPEGMRERTRQALERLAELRRNLEARERLADADAEAAPPPADHLRQWTRLELAARLLDRDFHRQTRALHPRQRLELRLLHPVDGWRTDDIDFAAAQTDGGSDLAGALDALLDEQHPMPLSAVLVLTDGRWSSRPEAVAQVLERYRNRGIPIHPLGVGSRTEPRDNALLRVQTPEFAIAGQAMPCRVELKLGHLPESGKVSLAAFLGDRELAAREVQAGENKEQVEILAVTLDEPGSVELTFVLAPVAGELLDHNRLLRVPVTVLPRRQRILYLEERPHWQARFVANALARLPHVELNRLVVQTLPAGELPRGGATGTWPASREVLDLYDVVILGDLPPERLDNREWQELLAWAEQAGRTLVVLAGAEYLPRQYAGHPLADLLPARHLEPVFTPTLADWMLTPAGAESRLTRAWRRLARVDQAAKPEVFGLPPDSVCLVYESRGLRPLLAWRPLGQGKIVLWNHPGAWLRLNAAWLDLHTGLWADLSAWSQRLNLATTQVVLDSPRTADDAPVAAVQANGPEILRVKPLDGGDEISIAGAALVAGLVRYPLGSLPAGRWALGDGEPPTVLARLPREPEFGLLARHQRLLEGVAQGAGGRLADVGDAAGLPALLEGREARQTDRFVFHLWRHWLTVAGLSLLVAAEWLLRKWAGKI